MAVQQQLDDYNHCKCPLPHQRKTLSQLDPTFRAGHFPKVRTGQLDHGWTGHFDNEIGFYQEFFLKNHLLCAYYLGYV